MLDGAQGAKRYIILAGRRGHAVPARNACRYILLLMTPLVLFRYLIFTFRTYFSRLVPTYTYNRQSSQYVATRLAQFITTTAINQLSLEHQKDGRLLGFYEQKLQYYISLDDFESNEGEIDHLRTEVHFLQDKVATNYVPYDPEPNTTPELEPNPESNPDDEEEEEDQPSSEDPQSDDDEEEEDCSTEAEVDVHESMVRKTNIFVALAWNQCHKHFGRWADTDLLFFGVASERNTAKCVAKTLLKNLQPPTQHIESNEEEELCVKHFLLDHLKEVDEKYDDSALSLVHKRMLSEKKFNAFLNSLPQSVRLF